MSFSSVCSLSIIESFFVYQPLPHLLSFSVLKRAQQRMLHARWGRPGRRHNGPVQRHQFRGGRHRQQQLPRLVQGALLRVQHRLLSGLHGGRRGRDERGRGGGVAARAFGGHGRRYVEVVVGECFQEPSMNRNTVATRPTHFSDIRITCV